MHTDATLRPSTSRPSGLPWLVGLGLALTGAHPLASQPTTIRMPRAAAPIIAPAGATGVPAAAGAATTPGVRLLSAPTAAGTVATSPLFITGPYAALPPQTITTAALVVSGPYSSLPAQTITTGALAVTGPFVQFPPQTVTTPALSITGPGAP